MSVLEETLAKQLHLLKVEPHGREYRFHPVRKWRFDLAWPALMVACEVEGGTWNGGRHTRGAGFEADCEKYAIAAIEGWIVVRVTSGMIASGAALTLIEQALAKRRETNA